MQQWRQLATKYFRRTLPSLPLQAFTFGFQSLHENIAWSALHVSRPHSDDQTICGYLAQFALLTSFTDQMMNEWRVFGGFPPLLKFWGEGDMNESSSVIDGCSTASVVCGVSQSVCSLWRSVPIIKKLHLVLPAGTDMTTCPCTGTCSAVGSFRPERHMVQK